MMSLGKKVVSGLIWQTFARGADRAGRLVTNIILARLLLPEDFGLAGVVMVVLAGVDAVTFIAVEQSIIQTKSIVDSKYLNTALRVTLIRGVLISIAIAALSPLAAWYFNQQHALQMFLVIAIQPILQGLVSPKYYLFAREMNFKVLSSSRALCSLLSFLLTIFLAYLFKSAWALIFGQISLYFFILIASYVIAPHKWCSVFDSEVFEEIKSYAKKAAGTPVFIMLVMQAPALLLGRISGLEVFGIFFMVQRLLEFPAEIGQQVVGAVALPAYSAISDDKDGLKKAYMSALNFSLTAVIPVLLSIMCMGNYFPEVVYGENYKTDYVVIGLLVSSVVFRVVSSISGPLFWASSNPDIDRNIQAVRAISTYLIGIPAVMHSGPIGMAATILFVEALAATIAVFKVAKLIHFRVMEVFVRLDGNLLKISIGMTFLLSIPYLLDINNKFSIVIYGFGVAAVMSVSGVLRLKSLHI